MGGVQSSLSPPQRNHLSSGGLAQSNSNSNPILAPKTALPSALRSSSSSNLAFTVGSAGKKGSNSNLGGPARSPQVSFSSASLPPPNFNASLPRGSSMLGPGGGSNGGGGAEEGGGTGGDGLPLKIQRSLGSNLFGQAVTGVISSLNPSSSSVGGGGGGLVANNGARSGASFSLASSISSALHAASLTPSAEMRQALRGGGGGSSGGMNSPNATLAHSPSSTSVSMVSRCPLASP